jgi:hypothetical protein
MSPNWQEPFVFMFEWGMFILGWGIVGILSLMAVLFVFAVFKAAYVVITKKKPVKAETKTTLSERINPRGGSLDDNPPKI